MPRSVPLRALYDTLHCRSSGPNRLAANSSAQYDRAKKPRSSVSRSMSTRYAPDNGDSVNIMDPRRYSADCASRVDSNHGHGGDESAAPLLDALQLLADFLLQVPRQNQHIVRPRLQQRL